MPDLPTGTVTFLFTDVEGSTRLWEQDPGAMRSALGRHDALIEDLVTRHEGVVVRPRGEGDSRFAVFARATDAVAAAVAIQRALLAEPWPAGLPLRVRIAVHTGEADLREGDYYGSAVNRCARLRSIAHGGQILLSQTTHDLVRHRLPEGIGFKELGEHRLADLTFPERVYQVRHTALPADFPTLRSLDAYPHNLPLQLTSFVGREREITEIKERLKTTRLLTLTGSGGCGKTRLALQVAADLLDAFSDGLFFVSLATISDPALVVSAIAQVLEVHPTSGRPIQESLRTVLRDKEMLLILDSFEQVLPAAPFLTEILAACPRLKIIVTSRAVLHVRGERTFPVPPLGLPDPEHLPTIERLTQFDAVRLFIERAVDVKSDFAVNNENAPAVAEICCRLDGLPLAIELAAARVNVFAPPVLLGRLDRRLRLLTGGARDVPARQRTLRATIAWSYDLLEESEQALFRQLAAFSDGCTLEAVEAIVGVEGHPPEAEGQESVEASQTQSLRLDTPDLIDGLSSLVDKSLVREEDQPFINGPPESRFRMLETIQEYAWEQLVAASEAAEVQRRHADYYLALVEDARKNWAGPEQRLQRRRLEREHDNVRAALRWAEERSDPSLAPRLTAAVTWVARVLLETFQGKAAVGDYERLQASARRSGNRAQELEALLGLAQAHYVLALDDQHRESAARTRELFEAAYVLAREIGDKPGMVRSLTGTAWLVDFWPEYRSRAEANIHEALALSQEVGDEDLVAESLLGGWWFLDRSEAEKYAEELVQRLRARGDLVRLNLHYFNLMWQHLYWGNFGRAVEYCDAGTRLAQTLDVPPVQYPTLKALALTYLGRYGEAWAALEQEIADDDHPFGRAMRDLGRGVYFYELLAFEKAVAVFREVVEEATRLERGWMKIWADIGLAAALVWLGQLPEAAAVDVRPLSEVTDIVAPSDVRAELLLREGKLDQALQQAEATARLAETRGRTAERLAAGEVSLRVLLALNRPADALVAAEAILATAVKLDLSPLIWRIHAAQGQALGLLDRDDEALAEYQAAAAIIQLLARAIPEPELRSSFLANPSVASVVAGAQRAT